MPPTKSAAQILTGQRDQVGVIYATGHEGMDECLFALPSHRLQPEKYCRT